MIIDNSVIYSILVIYILLIVSVEVYKRIHSLLYVFKNRHYVITGGSEGLGRALAKEIVKNGGVVTIVSRHEEKLKEAKFDIERSLKENNSYNGSINYVCCDVNDEESVYKSMKICIEKTGSIDVLISCAGYAETGYMFGMGRELYHKMMDVNYFGTLNVLYEVVPDMMKRNKGEVYIVSSAASFTSYIGYGSYSPTKYALRGLCDTLRNEVCRHHIHIGTIYPPNMLTPGFIQENKTKPEEGKFIEYFESAFTPEYCASSIIESIRRGDSNIFCNSLEGWALSVCSLGMSPRNNPFIDFLMMPIVAPLLLCTYYLFNAVVKMPRWRREEREKKWYPINKEKIM
ncbi:hypothetical protein WA158_002526 [Blastocystis sp. Blastoise]